MGVEVPEEAGSDIERVERFDDAKGGWLMIESRGDCGVMVGARGMEEGLGGLEGMSSTRE